MFSLAALEQEYNKAFTDVIEQVYGQDKLSQGGEFSFRLLEGESDFDSKRVLDVGCGFGAFANYLAKHHQVHVVGLDVVKDLINQAQERTDNQTLMGTVEYVLAIQENSLQHFNREAFDYVFSCESFLHIENKSAVLKEAYRTLKPGGTIRFIDWTKGLAPSKHLSAMMELDGLDLKLISCAQYERDLTNAGFIHAHSRSLNEHYIEFCQQNLKTLEIKSEALKRSLDERQRQGWLDSWEHQRKAFEDQEVIVALIEAHKPR